MSSIKNKKELIRAIKFTIFSLSAGAIELTVFELLNNFTDFSYWACYLPALIASVIWNFTLNRNFTFKSASNIPVAMTLVFLFYLIFTPTSTLFGEYLVGSLHWNETIVTLINMAFNFILEFLYDRFFVFRKSIDTRQRKK